MSDVEHELVTDLAETQATVRHMGEIALRALTSLREVQDAGGGHEAWIDEAIADITLELAALEPALDD